MKSRSGEASHKRPRAVRTFLDSGVLIAAVNGEPTSKGPALGVLKDPRRVFLSSPFVQLEVLSKARYFKHHAEYRFYQRYFRAAEMFTDANTMLRRAAREAARSGVGAMDALHLVAARMLRADEFVTTEKPRKSIHRSKLVKITYLYGPGDSR